MVEDMPCHSKSAVGDKAAINEHKPEEEEEEEEEAVMDSTLYKAVADGNISSFLELIREAVWEGTETSAKRTGQYLIRKTPAKNNILHVSLLYDQLEFTLKIASLLPQLITETNVDGNNPLHVAAQTATLGVVEDLVGYYQKSSEKLDPQGNDGCKEVPWKTQNKEGNTPLHVALIYGKLKVACYLVNLDPQLVRVRNNFMETPLHLAIRHRVNGDRDTVGAMMKLVAKNRAIGSRITNSQLENDSIKVVNLLLEKDDSVSCWQDNKGLTPPLTAVTTKPPYLEALEAILHHCPESAEVCDHFGNTFLHLLSNNPSCVDDIRFESDAPMAIKNMQNYDGNTPAHMAVKHHNIYMIQLLIELSANFAIKNKDGISAAALILEQSEDFRNTLKEKGEKYWRWFGRGRPFISNEEITALQEKDWNSLKEKVKEGGQSFFLKYRPYSNILHIFMKGNPTRFGEAEFEEFISEVLRNSPSLICEPDFNEHERNPLHLLVERAPNMITAKFLCTIDYLCEEVQHKGFIEELCYEAPWKAKDKNGDTLLHIALDQTFWKDGISWFQYIKCAREIIEFNPELVEEVDKNGEMPLHRLVREHLPKIFTADETAKKKLWDNIEFIISYSEAAQDKPDREGLTPLIRAAKNKDIQFILRLRRYSSVTLNYRDSKRNTLLHLLADMRLSESDAESMVSLSKLASRTIPECNEDGNTPIHLAIMNDNFILARSFWDTLTLMRDRNTIDITDLCDNDGNTLLHVAAGKSGSPLVQSLIEKVYESSLEGVLMSNKDRNTAMHLAILNDNLELARVIFDMFGSDKTSVRQILEKRDKDHNTLIHLAILEKKFEFIKLFLDIGEKVGCILEILHMPNIEGNSPLHLAIQVENPDFKEQIFNKFKLRETCVNQIQLSSNEDQNNALLPAIVSSNSSLANSSTDEAQEKKYIQELLQKSNNQGDSLLHLAIKNRDFKLARKFIECAALTSCINEILAKANAEQETPGQLIGSHSHLPGEFEKFFWNEPKVVEAMLGVRSLSGVSTSIIKEYTNTIGVIAALFATITFTAGFTVPGGLNSNTGTPLLMEKAAFQVFLVSDIIAMCLSMMVLFFLMWIMTINNEKHQVILLDLTVFSLQGAFYTTLFTFMMGLYITVSSVVFWIAILACALCSLLILLMHKRFIIWFIPSFIRIYVWFRKGYSWIRKLCGYIVCCGSNENIRIYVWFRKGYSWIKKLCGYIVCCGSNENKKNEGRSESSSHADRPTGHSEAVVDINSMTRSKPKNQHGTQDHLP